MKVIILYNSDVENSGGLLKSFKDIADKHCVFVDVKLQNQPCDLMIGDLFVLFGITEIPYNISTSHVDTYVYAKCENEEVMNMIKNKKHKKHHL